MATLTLAFDPNDAQDTKRQAGLLFAVAAHNAALIEDDEPLTAAEYATARANEVLDSYVAQRETELIARQMRQDEALTPQEIAEAKQLIKAKAGID